MILRNTLLAAAVLTGSAFAAAPGSAMPLDKTPGASPAQIELARWGCGPGFRPNRWGRCVPMMRPLWRGRHHYRHRYDRPVHRKRWEHRR